MSDASLALERLKPLGPSVLCGSIPSSSWLALALLPVLVLGGCQAQNSAPGKGSSAAAAKGEALVPSAEPKGSGAAAADRTKAQVEAPVPTVSKAAAQAGRAAPGRSAESKHAKAAPEPVRKACGQCHAVPDPRALPRLVWLEEVKDMYELADSLGVPMHGVKPAEVARWYGDQAPSVPPLYRGRGEEDAGPLALRAFERAATGAGALPGVTHVQIAQLAEGKKPGVLLSEMRTGQVLFFQPTRPEAGFQLLGTVSHPSHVEVVDLDADGRRDLLVASLGVFLPSDEPKGSVFWLRAQEGGGFRSQALVEGLGRVADARAADLDGDGDLDVVVASFGWRRVGEILVLEQRRGKRKTRWVPHRVVERTGSIHVPVADLNGDGLPDFVALFAQEHEQVSAFLNKGDFRFEEKSIYRAPHAAWGSSGMQLVDMDGDGDRDVLVTNGDTLDLSDSGGGELDAARLLMPYHGIRWLENRGSYPFTEHPVALLYGVHRAQAADMDGDGDLDIVASAFIPAAPHKVRAQFRLESLIWLEQRAPRSFVRHTLRSLDVEIPTLDVGDWDGDGDMDLVTGHLFLKRLRPDQRDVSITLWENIRGALRAP